MHYKNRITQHNTVDSDKEFEYNGLHSIGSWPIKVKFSVPFRQLNMERT